MPEPIRSVLIVGGGTAGWMAAAYLKRSLGATVQVTVIESQGIGRIGVGEASFNTLKEYFDTLGLREQDWMPPSGATFKIAIRFEGWSRQLPHFYHPFEWFPTADGFSIAEWWLRLREDGQPLDYTCLSAPHLCDRKRSPKFLDGTPFVPGYPYAYHFDAQLLADYLQAWSIAHGVQHIDGEVVDVALGENGWIEHLQTRDGAVHEADLYVDCTGFRGLLINDALGEPFIPYGDMLFCDRAVAARIPNDAPERDVEPYTTARTATAGWMWRIPLFDRIGRGYVYSSRFQSPEDAEAEFVAALGADGAAAQPRHLSMRIGRTRNAWVKNCVAIGLAAGFLEPLESTSIFLIQHNLTELVADFPGRPANDAVIRHYNRVVSECFDNVRDFIILHYLCSGREDTPFWRAVKRDAEVPESLQERLGVWREVLPRVGNTPTAFHAFLPFSYAAVLAGLGYAPETCPPALRARDDLPGRSLLRNQAERAQILCEELPSHVDYLRHLYGREQ